MRIAGSDWKYKYDEPVIPLYLADQSAVNSLVLLVRHLEDFIDPNYSEDEVYDTLPAQHHKTLLQRILDKEPDI